MSAGHHFAVQYARGGLPPCVRRRVHDYIAAHLDQKITNDALARIAGLSTTHFCAVFKQTEGMSPHCYVLQYRVRRTQQLLASTDMSLAEIADAVGFSNQSHCIQSFRKIVGVTPGDYRSSMILSIGDCPGAAPAAAACAGRTLHGATIAMTRNPNRL
jgi:AraC family transcriptional regulator